jgi:Acetyltransferase (GNAT) domain
VLALAERNLPATSEVSEWRYRKYYEGNPLGPPLFFLAREAESEAFVGMAALFQTALRVSGELVPAFVTGDFAVDADHRAFGPAIQLQRACLAAVAENDHACAYGSPNLLAESIIERVGYADLGRLTRFVKVLRAQVLVDQYVRGGRRADLAARLSTIAVDPLLSVLSRERLHRSPAGLAVEEPDAFDERFSGLWQASWLQHPVTAERNPDLLNWRYDKIGEQPSESSSRIFALTRQGEVVAYIVYRVKEGVRHIYDLLSAPSRSVVNALLSTFILDARRQGARAIGMLHLGSASGLARRFRSYGFIRRTEPTGVRLHAHPHVSHNVNLAHAANWYLLAGDQDI